MAIILGLKQQFINSFIEEVARLNGVQFEEIGRYVMELYTGQELIQKGHNPQGKPVGYTVDYEQLDEVTLVGQSGTDEDYFTSGKKPKKDVESSLKNCKKCNTVFLFSNRRATGGGLTNLKNELKAAFPKIKVRVCDSEAIALKVYEKISCENKVKQILKFLPMTDRYYQMYAHSHSIPTQSAGYLKRNDEEEICKLLGRKDLVQIYGLSGIGKTQLAIAVAARLFKTFDIVIWLDGESLNTDNLKAVHISSFDQLVSFEEILAHQRCLVVFDNLNKNVGRVKEQFAKFNKRGSKCIVTSLQRDLIEDISYNLKYLSKDNAKAILFQADNKPTLKQAEQLVDRIDGYPLLLNLIKAAVDCGDYTWEEIIGISELTELLDEKSEDSFAERIIGKYCEKYPQFFDILFSLETTRICKSFLYEYNLVQYRQMVKAAVLDENELFYCHLHSIIYESIKAVKGNKNDKIVLGAIHMYLDKHLLKRDAELYTFTSAHVNKLEDWTNDKDADSILKHKIVLACLYAQNTYINHEQYLDLINGLSLSPNDSLEDLLLTVERNEIFINKEYENSGKDEEVRKQITLKVKSEFEKLEPNISSAILKSVYYHHLAKWTRCLNEPASEELFLRALQYNPKSYNSHLQLARLYNSQRQKEKTYSHTDAVLADAVKGDVPLSVVLSVFSLMATSKHSQKLRLYLENDMEIFENAVEASISTHNTLVYYVLSKLSGSLSYEYSDVYNRLCNLLPSIVDIRHNEEDSYNYACILLRLLQYVDVDNDTKELHFQRALSILSSIDLRDDYRRRTLMTLYIAHDDADEALSVSKTFADKNNNFLLQSLCKAYCLKSDYDNALGSINKAISNDMNENDVHKAAFRHDKATVLYKLKDKSCLGLMDEAIRLQTNEKVRLQWKQEMTEWEDSLTI